ncbi:uncharacterized protein [Cherax quadricarinatus]|uniref:uncharacterized protein n=1 Tax=Cherax quadricarinatus TaxID=27406 RepID=UPI00387E879D
MNLGKFKTFYITSENMILSVLNSSEVPRRWSWVWLCLVAVSCSVQHNQQGDNVLLSLLHGPLTEDHILLVLGLGAHEILDIDAILASLSARHTSFVLVSEGAGDFFLKAPGQFLRGSHLAAVLVFVADTHLLDSLNQRWNPEFLVLLSLNATLNSEILLRNDKIQRCRHIVLIEPDTRFVPQRFKVSTSKPTHPNTTVKYSMGPWDEKVFTSKSNLFPERFNNFGGTVINLGTWCDGFPFIYLENDECLGSNLDVLEIIAVKLNFTYTVQKEPKDHQWGSRENGTWTGMLGDLIYNNKDLTINGFTLTEEIYDEFDVSYPYQVESYVFLLRVPPPLPKWRGLTYPFTGVLWLTIIFTTMVVSISFTLCLLLLPNNHDPYSVFLLLPEMLSITRGFLYSSMSLMSAMVCIPCTCTCRNKIIIIVILLQILGGLVYQGVKGKFENTWTRLWIGCWWLACVIIATAYNSNLVAFLTVPVYPKRIETLEELAASNLRVCMQDYGSFVPEALKVSTDLHLYKLGHNLDLYPYVYQNFQVGITWVMGSTHALIDTYSYMGQIVNLTGVASQTYIMKEMVYPGYLSWILRRNCPYTVQLSEILTGLLETGIIDHLFNNHTKKYQGKDNHHDKVRMEIVVNFLKDFLLVC